MFLKSSKSHFIIAAPRSGTTWMSKMLNAHPRVFCVERRLFGNYADFILDQGNDEPRLRVTLDKYLRSMLLHHGFSKSVKNKLMQSFLTQLLKEEKTIIESPNKELILTNKKVLYYFSSKRSYFTC